MPARIFLLLSGLLWLPYGVYCFLVPASLAAAAGVAAQTPTGLTELRAMYGGLQVAIGALALLGAAGTALRRPALLAIAFLTGGLATARLLGVVLDGGLSAYTLLGLGFEIASVLLATALLRRSPRP